MKKHVLVTIKFAVLVLTTAFMLSEAKAQSYPVGPPSPAVGTNANYTSHNHYNIFDVLNPTGVYLDSITIYPSTAATSYTIVVQNSSQVQVGSYTGVSTVGGNMPERIKANIFVPFGTGYRLGLTTGSVGMLRNADGILFPYTVPGVISFTGATFGTTYWYFFYDILATVPVYETDAGISAISSPGDSVCSGLQPVEVTLNNYGPSNLAEVKINWKVNDVLQPEYNWSGSLAANASTTVNIGDFNFLTGTAYEIVAYTTDPNTLPDTINNLNDTAVKSGIYVVTAPTAAFTTPNTIVCQGDSVTLEGTMTGMAPWTIVLNDGSTTHTLSNLQTGTFSANFNPATLTTYILTSVADQGGCVTLVNDTVEIIVMPIPPAIINAQSPTTFCPGDSATLMGSVGLGFSYQWYRDGTALSGDTNFVYTAKLPGSYTVRVISPNGCAALSAPTAVIVHPAPAVFLGNDTALLPGNKITLDAGPGFNSYAWSTGQTSQIIEVDSSGTGTGVKTVWVIVADNNCSGGDTININFTDNIGLEDAMAKSEIRIYPNPSDGNILLDLSQLPVGPYNIEVYSIDGKLNHRSEHMLSEYGNSISLDLSNLNSGSYILRITGAVLSLSKQLLINKK